MDSAALDWRLESFHRPYHAALAEALVEARGRFGHAILIDLHSMPSIPVGQPGHGARIVVGDRFGGSAGEWLIDRVMTSAGPLGAVVTGDQPYSGGRILRNTGRPGAATRWRHIKQGPTRY